MLKRTIIPGLLGSAVLIVWGFVVNGVLGFRASIDMNQIPKEREVYEVLKQHVVEPGRYVVNQEITAENSFPPGEPVYSILYGGMGHEAAGGLMFVGLLVFCLAPIIGAWMLSLTSERTLSSYPRKVLFFASIGLLFALYGDLTAFGIGGYPLKSVLILAFHDVASWTLVGVVVGWRMRPERVRSTA
jgi:hypothetical protein